MLLDLTMRRLEDEETMEARFTPGFFNASRAAKGIRELVYGNNKYTNSKDLLKAVTSKTWVDPEQDYDYSEISSILYYNKQNQIAEKEIGVFANHNTAHAYATLFDKLELSNVVAFGSRASKAEGLKDLVHRNDPKMRQYSELMVAELLAASVDAVKDPVLNYLNIN